MLLTEACLISLLCGRDPKGTHEKYRRKRYSARARAKEPPLRPLSNFPSVYFCGGCAVMLEHVWCFAMLTNRMKMQYFEIHVQYVRLG